MKLISENERLVYQIGDGAKIYYKRPSQTLRDTWIRKYTKRGLTDWTRVAEAGVRYAIIDWEGIEDEHGNPAECTPANIMKLPQDIYVELTEVMGLSEGESAEDEEGN